MQFGGSNRPTLAQSREVWETWRQKVHPNSNQFRFAAHLVALIEARVGSPQPHVAGVAPKAVEEAMARLGTPLTAEQVREVFVVLYRCWRYGLALRNWVLRQGYMRAEDQ